MVGGVDAYLALIASVGHFEREEFDGRAAAFRHLDLLALHHAPVQHQRHRARGFLRAEAGDRGQDAVLFAFVHAARRNHVFHGKVGFFMNWMGKQGGEGFEYHLLAIAILLVILIAGPGRYALARSLPLPKFAE